jgi:hypothetical protein
MLARSPRQNKALFLARNIWPVMVWSVLVGTGIHLWVRKGNRSMSKARARERAKARAGQPAKKRDVAAASVNQNSWPGQAKIAGKDNKGSSGSSVDAAFSRTQRGSARSG